MLVDIGHAMSLAYLDANIQPTALVSLQYLMQILVFSKLGPNKLLFSYAKQ